MFDLPDKPYKSYPIIVYVMRDILLYLGVFLLICFLDAISNSVNLGLVSLISAIIALALGSFMMISFHEWAHYFGTVLFGSKVTMLPVTSLMRLFYYRFRDNSSKQNLGMMISGLVFNFLIFIPLMVLLPNETLVFIMFKVGAVLWMAEIILIELYIGWPRYMGKMDYNQCYKRHTPHRKRNLYLSLVAALPFVAVYLIPILR